MEDCSQRQRSLNPWALHLQKLSLELKCPLCLDLLNRPTLLPCNHLFCDFCIPRSTQYESECPSCKHLYVDRDIRPVPYMENIITIYRSLDDTFNASLRQSSFNAVRVSQQSPISVKKTNADAKLQREYAETPQWEKSSSGPSIFSQTANKCAEAHASHSDYIDIDSVTELTKKTGKTWRTGQEEDEKQIELGKEEIDTNKKEQLALGSHTCSGDTKDINGNSRLPGGISGSVEKSTAKRLVENILERSGGEMNNSCTLGAECSSRDAKRQKNLNDGFFKTSVEGNNDTRYNNLNSENMTSDCKLVPKFEEPLSTLQSNAVSDSQDSDKSACGFCNSSKITDGTGPMLHYANGKEVVGNLDSFSKVIHVHTKCIEWTPQVYFEGETIKQLESELARAAKLKCSKCGVKGAALGCFMKSCRKSFHVPCALTLDCKWDCGEFLMLCPTHNSFKFPRENSISEKHASGEKHTTQANDIFSTFGETLPSGVKERVFCGSGLSDEEKYRLVDFASRYGATVSGYWKSNVTHVIAATDENGACTRTVKFLMGILYGRWILTMDWIKACIREKKLVDEEPYEVSLENHGYRGGPKIGRLRALTNAPKLFNSLKFYFSGDFVPEYKKELQNLVTIAGGTVIESREQLMAGHPSTTLVVFNSDPPQCSLGGADAVLKRLVEAEGFAAEIGSRFIRHTLILDSIAACNLQLLPLPWPAAENSQP